MGKVAITQHVFNDPETGRIVNYERLTVTGYINGEQYTVELRVTKTEANMIKALLASEESHTEARKATQEEEEEYLRKQREMKDADASDWLNN